MTLKAEEVAIVDDDEEWRFEYTSIGFSYDVIDILISTSCMGLAVASYVMPPNNTILTFLSANVILSSICLLSYFRAFPLLAEQVELLGQIVLDMRAFVVVLFCLLMGSSLALFILLHNEPDQRFDSFSDAVHTTFLIGFFGQREMSDTDVESVPHAELVKWFMMIVKIRSVGMA